MNDNIYSAPKAQLSNTLNTDQYGSLERGINGDYEISVGAILNEAWAKTKGAKWTFQVALSYYLIIYFVLSAVVGFIFTGHFQFGGAKPAPGDMVMFFVKSQLQGLIVYVIAAPIGAGLFMLCLRRAMGAPISASSIFSYYDQFFAIGMTRLVSYFAVIIGFLLLVIPGIYLSIALMCSTPLVVDKKLDPIAAIKTSRTALSHRWFNIFGLYLTLGLINLATVFTLFIGLLWTIPMTMIAGGILYRNIFGCEPETLAD